jgi:hypothetical protein
MAPRKSFLAATVSVVTNDKTAFMIETTDLDLWPLEG